MSEGGRGERSRVWLRSMRTVDQAHVSDGDVGSSDWIWRPTPSRLGPSRRASGPRRVMSSSPSMPTKPDALEPKDIPGRRTTGPGMADGLREARPFARSRASTRSCWSHLDPSTLVGSTKERAAEGVVAYSAICPHAGCEVNGWLADQQILECSCHYSHYNPREAAAVMDGPATRSLAALPLKIVEGKLTVAKPFTGRVGIVPT